MTTTTAKTTTTTTTTTYYDLLRLTFFFQGAWRLPSGSCMRGEASRPATTGRKNLPGAIRSTGPSKGCPRAPASPGRGCRASRLPARTSPKNRWKNRRSGSHRCRDVPPLTACCWQNAAPATTILEGLSKTL